MSRATGYPPVSLSDPRAAWLSYQDALDWIKAHTAPQDILAANMDSMVYLYTGRRSFRPYVPKTGALFYGVDAPPLGSVEELDRIITTSDAGYLVQFAMPGFAEDEPFRRLVAQLVEFRPGRFTAVYRGQDSRFVVYSVRR